MNQFAALTAACREQPPLAALVLGSGLNQVVDDLPQRHAIAFAELPGMPATSIAGHRGRLCLIASPRGPLLVFQGRLHYYEGHSWDLVARPVCLAAELGARVLILTNASGGIGPAQQAGTLMAVRDHIAAMPPYWYRRECQPSPYSPRLLELLKISAKESNIELSQGVYACVTGPNYETPAEVRALRTLGADAVGMSTVHEANTAAALGMEVAAISCVANRAAGLSATPLSHAEVLAQVSNAAHQMTQLLKALLLRL